MVIVSVEYNLYWQLDNIAIYYAMNILWLNVINSDYSIVLFGLIAFTICKATGWRAIDFIMIYLIKDHLQTLSYTVIIQGSIVFKASIIKWMGAYMVRCLYDWVPIPTCSLSARCPFDPDSYKLHTM